MNYAAAQNIWNDVYESTKFTNNKALELLVPTWGMRNFLLYYKVADFPETEVEKFYNENPRYSKNSAGIVSILRKI